MYKITIKIKNQDLVFTTSTYSISNNRISFRDKFGNRKDFAATPETLIGIEEANSYA